MPSKLADWWDQLHAVLAGVQDQGSPLFGSPPRIRWQGELYDTTDLPVAAVQFADEDADENGTKTDLSVDGQIEVVFDSASILANETIRQTHARLASAVKDALMADRELGGHAIDVHYTGGSTALEPIVSEADSERWRFTVRIRVQYRHETGDSSSI